MAEYSALDVVSREIQGLADASIEFVLHRDGIVVFSEPVFKPSGKLDEAEERYVVADRMYALLKDFCHIHQHHSSEADEVIRLKRVENPDSFLWARDILLEMYSHIVGMKRDPGTPAYQYTDALGVLAYAQSFRKIVENRWRCVCPERPAPFFDLHDSELRASLNAARDGEQMRYERGQALAVQFAALLIAITAVFLSFLQTVGQFKPSELRTDTVAEWAITHVAKNLTLYGGMIFPILILSSFVWAFIWHKRQAYEVLYGIYRLLLSTPQRINAGFWFAIAVVLLLGSLFAALLLLARG